MRFFLFAFLLGYSHLIRSQVPTPDHVVIVVFENRSYFDIIEDPNFVPPYINSLAKDSNYGVLFTQSFAITHPSQPNYLHLFSGDDQGVTEDDTPSNAPFTTANLAASLIANGKTFSAYSEDLPYPGFTGDSTTSVSPPYLGLYARKHCPWVNWQGNGVNQIDPSLSQPFTSFPTSDYSTLPTVSFVIPNMDHDMHNLGRTVADNWLSANLDGYVQWAKSNNSLLIITWDEDDYSEGNQITTIFFGPMVSPGMYDEAPNGITHHNVLRTIEDMYGLAHSGQAATATPITDVWLIATPIQLTSFSAISNPQGVKLNWSTASELNNDYFTIQNSSNGIDFFRIDIVKGAGTTNEPHRYEYLHQNPFVGKSYYQLKQTDYSGKVTHSKIIATEFKPEALPSVFIYPNPTDGNSVQLKIKNFDREEVQISIIDLLGNRLESQTIAFNKNEDATITINLKHQLTPGIYIVQVADISSQKMVVSK